MSETVTPVLHRLDIRRQVCPYNLVLAQKELIKLKGGDHLEILLDSLASLETIPRWAKLQGHRFISSQAISDSEWAIILEKGA